MWTLRTSRQNVDHIDVLGVKEYSNYKSNKKLAETLSPTMRKPTLKKNILGNDWQPRRKDKQQLQ
jgi:hypothetical protein